MAEIDTVLWSWGPGESRFALVAGGRCRELRVARPAMVAGSTFLGRVVEIQRGMDAAFVEIGQARPGLLGRAAGLGLVQGQAVAVCARAEPWDGKGTPLVLAPDRMAAESLTGPVPRLLHRPHPLERILAAHPAVRQVLVDDDAALAEARALCGPLARRIGGNAFDEADAAEAWDQALQPLVPLPGGGRLAIEATQAVTAIDVDSGSGHPADANRHAVPEIARQLRLRGIGGQVVIDFVSAKGKPYRLAEALKKAVAADPVPVRVLGVSPMGLVELVRDRTGPALAGLCASPQGWGLEGLRRLLAAAAARPGRPLALCLAPEAAAALPDAARAEAAARLGSPPTIRSQPGRRLEDLLIEDA